MRHNHATRDIKPPGKCPECDLIRMIADTRIKTLACPLCGSPPVLAVGAQQFFCGNEDCKVLAWNPMMGPEQLENVSFVELPEPPPRSYTRCPTCGRERVHSKDCSRVDAEGFPVVLEGS